MIALFLTAVYFLVISCDYQATFHIKKIKVTYTSYLSHLRCLSDSLTTANKVTLKHALFTFQKHMILLDHVYHLLVHK